MLTERLQAVVEDAGRLPTEEQDRVAQALEAILKQLRQTPSEIAPDVRAAIDRAMAQHAATLEYLKDK